MWLRLRRLRRTPLLENRAIHTFCLVFFHGLGPNLTSFLTPISRRFTRAPRFIGSLEVVAGELVDASTAKFTLPPVPIGTKGEKDRQLAVAVCVCLRRMPARKADILNQPPDGVAESARDLGPAHRGRR